MTTRKISELPNKKGDNYKEILKEAEKRGKEILGEGALDANGTLIIGLASIIAEMKEMK